jgi:hypothetical protein
MQRRHLKQADTLEHRLAEEAKRLREEARLLPPCATRDETPIRLSGAEAICLSLVA